VSFQQVIHQNLQRILYDEPERVKMWVRDKFESLTGERKLPKDPPMYLQGMHSKHHPTKAKKGDNSRLSEMQPSFSSGKMYIRSTHTKLRDEALDYPNGPDNCLDALYYGRLKVYKPSHSEDMIGAKPTPKRHFSRQRVDWQTI